MAFHLTYQSWTKIESRTRNWDFTKNLSNSIHDPLWMLTRQWQFGEFQGEDAGALAQAKIYYHHAPVDHLSLAGNAPQMIDHSIPLDAAVEQITTPLDLHLRMQMGRHWLKMLEEFLPETQSEAIKGIFSNHPDLQFKIPTLEPDQEWEEQANILTQESNIQMLHTAIRLKRLDGGALYTKLKSGSKASTYLAEANPEVDEVGDRFVAWFDRTYSQPASPETDAWEPNRLEYQFGYSARQKDGRWKPLEASEYHGRQLGWYSSDFHGEMSTANAEHVPLESKAISIIPSPVRFAGMPHPRWWRLEDNTINFGDIGMAKTDIAKLIFAEFGLVYGNDWMLTPLNLPVGHMAKIEKITVMDSFGVQTEIQSANEMKPEEPWQMFHLFDQEGVDHQLFLAPINTQIQESKPIEEVHFMRDEMANMVWGIEKIIPNGLGDGMDGQESGIRKRAFLNHLVEEEVSNLLKNDATVAYKLTTQVPEHWIPFIAKKIGKKSKETQIRLQRAAMPRVLKGRKPERIRPRTSLLRKGLENAVKVPYFIQEEEIPRSGSIISTKWRRTRWLNGKVVVWLARERTNGRGEADSALQFDRIQNKAGAEHER